MKYNFDEIVSREGTYSKKMESFPAGTPADCLPLWIADMDLPCAEPIIRALHERIDRRIFGYTEYNNPELKNAVTGWFRRRYDWEIPQEQLVFSPGVVPALGFLVNALTAVGDHVIIQPPVYAPFYQMIEENGRQVTKNPLIYENGAYRMDYEDLERKLAAPENKGLIFCSPHNPVGRVWREEELLEVVELCKRHGKWLVCDEIHCDLTRIGVKHSPILKIADGRYDRIIACTAPSKTFNLAGMQLSNIVIPNPEYRKLWMKEIDKRYSLSICNPFGLTAVMAAYQEGEEWLDQVREYLDGNIAYVKRCIEEHFPQAVVSEAQGTYLMWVNFNAYCRDPQVLEHFMQHKARLLLDEGYIFGSEGNGFERFNIASPRAVLEECMRRLTEAWPSLANE